MISKLFSWRVVQMAMSIRCDNKQLANGYGLAHARWVPMRVLCLVRVLIQQPFANAC